MISTITTKGQVTIPVSIRKKFGLCTNDRVDFVIEGDKIFLIPVKTLQHFRGSVTGTGDKEKERQAAKEAVSRRTIEKMS